MKKTSLHLLICSVLCCCHSFAHGATDFDKIDANHDGVISREELEAREKDTKKTSPPVQKEPAAEDSSDTAESEDGFIQFIERNFEIRETFFSASPKAQLGGPNQAVPSDSASTSPAKLSWTKTADSGAFYQIDAALLWKPEFLNSPLEAGKLNWSVQPNFEAHVSTEEGSAQDQLTWRVPIILDYTKDDPEEMDDLSATSPPRFFATHRFIVAPIFQTDRTNGTRTLQAELYYTPTIPPLMCGIRKSIFGNDNIQFLWRPYIGFELGDYLDRDAATQTRVTSTVSRFVYRSQGELMLGTRFTLVGSFVHRTELNGDNHSFDYGELSAVVALDKARTLKSEKPAHFTAGVTFKRGKDTPTFANGDEITAWLGVQF